MFQGMFRRLPANTATEESTALDRMYEDMLTEVNEETYCRKVRLLAAGSSGDFNKQKHRQMSVEADISDAPDITDSEPWFLQLQTARTIMRLRTILVQEITENNSRLFSYMTE